MHRLLHFLVFISFIGAIGFCQEATPTCRPTDQGGQHLEQTIEGFRLTLDPGVDVEEGCFAKLLDPQGKVVWTSSGWMLRFSAAPFDVNNDGHLDFIVEDYSGGAHCCWTYTIVSPHLRPYGTTVLKNETPIDLEIKWRGKNALFTDDGAFDYFITSHAFSFMPDVYLLLEGKELIDISGEREFTRGYDHQIAEGRKELERLDPTKHWMNQSVAEMDDEIKFNILRIVLSYLYSRRATEAWRALDELWPATDVANLKAEILKSRRGGILRKAVPYSPPARH